MKMTSNLKNSKKRFFVKNKERAPQSKFDQKKQNSFFSPIPYSNHPKRSNPTTSDSSTYYTQNKSKETPDKEL